MKRILILSDSHHFVDFNNWNTSDYDVIFHLGDGVDDLKVLNSLKVRGNCDYWSSEPDKRIVEIDGVSFLLVHGHKQQVKRSLDILIYLGLQEKVDCILFGHTHEQYSFYHENMLVLNPGSIASGFYATLSVQDGKIISHELINSH